MRPPRIIETDRLRLRPVVRADAFEIYSTYASHSDATRFMDFRRHRDPAEAVAFAERCEQGWCNGPFYTWAIIKKTSTALMGTIELRSTPPKADFGYILGSDFWGHGFATEAAKAVVDWAIGQSGIYRVWATCHPDNRASAHVLEKAGLVYEAVLANWNERPQLGEAAGASLIFARIKPALSAQAASDVSL